MLKYVEIAQMLKRRILNEDYALSRMPGARKLASEVGVSYMTARQAVSYLLDDGVLIKEGSGRCVVNPEYREKKTLTVAFLSGQGASNYNVWENAVRRAADELGANFRAVHYSHNDDPVIAEVINGDFDLVFFKHVLVGYPFIKDLVIRNRDKVITLFHDLSSHGVRCFDGPEPVATTALVEYLYGLGHRRFASFHISMVTESLASKLDFWEGRIREYGLESQRFEFELDECYEYSLVPAYDNSGLVFAGSEVPTAVFCPSLEYAIGLCRYCHEHGTAVGSDISICSFGQPEQAATYIPSITIIDRPQPYPQALEIISDCIAGNKDKLVYRPEDGGVLLGESTGAPCSG